MLNFKKIVKLMGYVGILLLVVGAIRLFFIAKNTSGYVLAWQVNQIIPQTQAYFDTTNLSWAKALRLHVNDIKAEYENYLHLGKKLPNIAEVEVAMQEYDSPEAPWKVIVLRAYNKDTANMQFFPKLQQFLKDVPGCSTVMFSILEPGKIIKPHQGPYRGVLRYHLGLEVPPANERDNCKIVVNGIPYSWKFGEDVLFDDTYIHDVANKTKHRRVILFLNVERPLSGYKKYINKLFLFLFQYNQTVEEVVNNTNKFVHD